MTQPYCTRMLFNSSRIGWFSISYGERNWAVFLIERHLWHGKPHFLDLLLFSFLNCSFLYIVNVVCLSGVCPATTRSFHPFITLSFDYLMIYSLFTSTSGNWDIKTQVPHQCSVSKMKLPDYFMEWINIKDVYLNFYTKKVQQSCQNNRS